VADPAVPASTVYRPLRVHLSSAGEGGGVYATVTPDENGYSVIYDPQSIFANEDGMIAIPKVDLAEEAVNVLMTKSAFKANLSIIKVEEEMMGELLDTLA